MATNTETAPPKKSNSELLTDAEEALAAYRRRAASGQSATPAGLREREDAVKFYEVIHAEEVARAQRAADQDRVQLAADLAAESGELNQKISDLAVGAAERLAACWDQIAGEHQLIRDRHLELKQLEKEADLSSQNPAQPGPVKSLDNFGRLLGYRLPPTVANRLREVTA